MNIEDLTKTQLLMLTILVNFIVSIATGVLVISMLDQTAAPVTQTVQQIVDHTIETISTPIRVSTPSKPTPAAQTPEQQLTAAISADVARSVTIHYGATTTVPIAIGTYLPKSRAVATATGPALMKEVTIVFSNGTSADASLSKQGNGITIYGFSDTAALPDAPAANPVAAASLKQGQTVIALTKDKAALTGIISKIDATGITTSFTGVPSGAASVDLSGNLVGISSGAGLFLPTDRIMSLLETSAPHAP
jgi:hypothetical protein